MATTKYKTKFCPSWRKEVIKNDDGIDELYDWVTPVHNDDTKASCSLCIKSKPFTISSGGIADCKRHAKGKGHMSLIKARGKQRTLLKTSTSNLSVGVCQKDKVTKAEIG